MAYQNVSRLSLPVCLRGDICRLDYALSAQYYGADERQSAAGFFKRQLASSARDRSVGSRFVEPGHVRNENQSDHFISRDIGWMCCGRACRIDQRLHGGIADKVIMSVVDFQFAVPYTLMLLMGLVLFGTDIPVFIVLLGLAYWENYARITRGLVLSLREKQYVEAALASGASSWYVITRHIFPNTVPTILVMLTLYFPAILTLESSLSFLGIGIQPPTSSLGKMVGEGRNYLINQWWISIIPSLVILAKALIIQTIGDWLSKVMEISKH